MSKKLLFPALFLLFFTFPAAMWASSGGPATQIFTDDSCYAPAPDSFRITEMGSNSIRLEWQSVAPGLSYSLEILRKNSAGGWDPLYAISNITDAFYHFQSNDPGGTSYRFKLRTNCNIGNPSEYFISIDGITTILDLTLGGRTPINPQPIFCGNIPLNTYEWVGFKVSKHVPGQGIVSSLFEYDENENDTSLPLNFPSVMYLKRVEVENLIVASTLIGDYPNLNFPTFTSQNPTFMRDYVSTPAIQIGKVKLTRKNLQGPRISMCKDPSSSNPFWQWDEENYIFQTMVAFSVYPELNDDEVNSRNTSSYKNTVKVMNPFSEDLLLFNLSSIDVNSELHVRVSNINMQAVYDQRFHTHSDQLSLPLNLLKSGVYILTIQAGGEIKTFKVVKTN